MSRMIHGLHPVAEALRAGGGRMVRIVVAEGRHDARLAAIVAAARAAGVPVSRQPAAALDRLAGGGSHQGVVAVAAAAAYADAGDLLASASHPALFVVLDGVEDPHNLGAVIRSAAAAGADGLFIPERGAAGLTATALKVAAGAAEILPVARVTNIVSTLKRLKDKGIWIAGLDPGAPSPWTSFDLSLPLAIVIGGEGRGLRRLARETCDILLGIPLKRGVESLNLSVAAGIVLFEAVRQRQAAGGGRAAPGPGGSAGPQFSN